MNVTEYGTYPNGTKNFNNITGWHWEPGQNTDLFDTSCSVDGSKFDDTVNVTCTLSPNAITEIVLDTYNPSYSDSEAVAELNSSWMWKQDDWNTTVLDTVKNELTNIPVTLDGTQQETVDISGGSLSVSYTVDPSTDHTFVFGSHSTVVATEGGSSDSYDSYTPVNVTEMSGQPTINNFPAYLKLNDTDINWSAIDGKKDIDITNTTDHRKPFYFENFSTAHNVTEVHFRGNFTRDGTEHFRIHHGSGTSDESHSQPTIYDQVSDIKGSWDKNESSGDAKDRTSGNYDGTVTGATQGVDGQLGQSYNYDGSDDYTDVGGNNAFNASQGWTVETWVKFDSLGNPSYIVSKRSGSNIDWILWQDDGTGGGDINWKTWDTSGTGMGGATIQEFASTDTWYHMVATYDDASGDQKLYINGDLKATASTSNTVNNGNYPVTFAADSDNSNNADAAIDEVQLFDAPKSQDYLQARYNMSPKGDETLFTLGQEQTSDDGGGGGGDTTDPTITIHDPTNSTFASSTLDLNVTADETIDTWQYSTDGGSNTTFTPNTTLSSLSDGSHTVRVYANDTSGNNGSAIRHFTVDTTAPTISYNPSATSAGTYSQSWILWNVSASDSRLSVVTELFDGTNTSRSEDSNGNYWHNHSGLSDGTYTMQGFANDTAQNTDSTGERSITLDTTPPSTSNNWSQGGWQNKDQAHISLSCSDTTAGCDRISYRTDGGSWTTASGSSTTVTITSDGNTTLEYNSTDSAENTEATQTEYVALDTTAPSFQEQHVNGSRKSGVYDNGENLLLTIETQDTHSGVNKTKIAINDSGDYTNTTIDLFNATTEVNQNSSSESKNRMDRQWQTFTPSTSGELRYVDFALLKSGGAGDLWVEVRNNDTNALLANVSRNFQESRITGQQYWRRFGPIGIDITSGTALNVTIRAPEETNSDYWRGFYHTNNQYSGGYGSKGADWKFRIIEQTKNQDTNNSGGWLAADHVWKNTSFRGKLGYKFYTKDGVRTWENSTTYTLDVNKKPAVVNTTLNWTVIGADEVTNLTVGITDPDANIQNASAAPSGTSSVGQSFITVSNWVSPFDWFAQVSDDFIETTSARAVNFTATKHHTLVENATGGVNESRQAVNTSVTLNVRGDAMNYSVTAATPGTVKETVRDDDQDPATTTGVTGTIEFVWYWFADTITETVFNEYEDTTHSHTLSTQGVAKDKELGNNDSIAYSRLNVTAPSISGTCSNCEEREIAVSGNTATNETYNSTGDFISSEKVISKTQQQDTGQTSNITAQTVWNQTALQVDNGKSFQFTDVDLSSQCDVTTTSDVGSGTVNATTSCTNDTTVVDDVAEKEFDFSPQPAEKHLSVNYIGDRALELTNNRGFDWTDLDTTPGVTTPRGCSQTNNTVVNLSASATANWTVQMSCDPGQQINGTLTKTLDVGDDNHTEYNYTGYINISSNETRQIHILHNIDKSELTDFSDRTSPPTGYIDGNSTDVFTTVKTSNVEINYSTDCCSSSPSQGLHSYTLNYPVDESDTTTSSGGGGGGGGGGGLTGDDDDENTGFRFRITDTTAVPFNTTRRLTLSVDNFIDRENTATLTAAPSRSNGCQYIKLRNTVIADRNDQGRVTVQEGDSFAEQATFRLPPREPDNTRVFIAGRFIQVEMPDRDTYDTIKNENGTIRCIYEADASHGTVDDLVVEVRPGFDPFAFLRAVINKLVARLSGGQFDHIPTSTLSASVDRCTDPSVQLNASASIEDCPEDARQSIPVLPVAGIGLVVAVVGGLAVWRRL